MYKLNPGDPLVPVALAPGNNKNNNPFEAETRCPGFKLTHTTEWKHPWFEPLKLKRDVLVSVSEFALKWVNLHRYVEARRNLYIRVAITVLLGLLTAVGRCTLNSADPPPPRLIG